MNAKDRWAIGVALATITLSSFFGFTAARVSGFFSGQYDVYVSLFLLSCFFLISAYLLYFERIEDYFWSLEKKASLRNPIFGIIRVEGCHRGATRFTPDDWRQRLEDLSIVGLTIKMISPKEISKEYSVLINPYGEYYPEEDLVNLRTLQRIKEYISEGELF